MEILLTRNKTKMVKKHANLKKNMMKHANQKTCSLLIVRIANKRECYAPPKIEEEEEKVKSF